MGVADQRNHAAPHKCYRAKFGPCKLNGTGVWGPMEIRQKNGAHFPPFEKQPRYPYQIVKNVRLCS